MPYQIVRNDLTKMNVDVIVNSAHPENKIGLGLDGLIHKNGGENLVKDRLSLGVIKTSEVQCTKGYNLPSNYVFHTVGPVNDGNPDMENLLRKTYQNCLSLARKMEVESIAFPLISSGVFGYPKREALLVAQEEILRFLKDSEMMIYIVVYDEESFSISKEFRRDITEYIKSVEFFEERMRRSFSRRPIERSRKVFSYVSSDFFEDNKIGDLDEGFSNTLLKLISDTGEKDSTIYKKANIDRKHFSKIRNKKDYKPSKNTVCAFIIALELNKTEAEDLLERAGYALSNSFIFDKIIKYCIEREIYDVYEVNNILFDYDQETLGVRI